MKSLLLVMLAGSSAPAVPDIGNSLADRETTGIAVNVSRSTDSNSWTSATLRILKGFDPYTFRGA